MKKCLILFLLLCVLSCTIRYTRIGEDEVTSVDERIITYYMLPVSMPSIDSPYIIIEVSEIVRVFRVCKHQAKEKKLYVSNFIPFVGVVPGVFLMSSGYVVLGRDIIGLSLATLFLGNIISFPEKIVSRYTDEEYLEKRIPYDEEFVLSLVGKDYSGKYLPDRKGLLRINITDFSSFYKENESFEFKLISPRGDSLDLVIHTDEFLPLFKIMQDD